jgi:uncharacterized damage-inducible protein DinB
MAHRRLWCWPVGGKHAVRRPRRSPGKHGKLAVQRAATSEFEIREVLLETYAANGAMNQRLLAHLDPRAWRASRVDQKDRGGWTLSGIFAHLHNNRLSWLRSSAPHLRCPATLDPARCTIKQAIAAHRESATRCLEMLTDALSRSRDRRVTKFSRGSWAPVWPAGATMFAYMFAHDAHHRGQIIMLARELGYPLPDEAAYGIWRWEKLWKQCGFATRPRFSGGPTE